MLSKVLSFLVLVGFLIAAPVGGLEVTEPASATSCVILVDPVGGVQCVVGQYTRCVEDLVKHGECRL